MDRLEATIKQLDKDKEHFKKLYDSSISRGDVFEAIRYKSYSDHASFILDFIASLPPHDDESLIEHP